MIKLDPETKTLTGKDKFATELVFHYQSTTKIRTLGASESLIPVSTFVISETPLPLRPEQDILVKWKADTQKNHV
ncbi:MAG TPA: hypothetical protein VF121_14610 [Thermoanaerobaculia bacterium]|nr:hypothetical protein [Thermoanaerobaculia bacterium]